MSPARKGVRARIPCPEDCEYSKYRKGIDVRGLKGHLISNHGYTQERAAKKFEEIVGRPSLGRVSKPAKAFNGESPQPAISSTPSDDQARAWFAMGFEMGMKAAEKLKGQSKE